VVAEIVGALLDRSVAAELADERLGSKDVVPHRDERPRGIARERGRIGGFLVESGDPGLSVDLEAAEAGALRAGHREARDGDVGAPAAVHIGPVPDSTPVTLARAGG